MGVLISAEAADKITVYQPQKQKQMQTATKTNKIQWLSCYQGEISLGFLCLNTCVPGAVSVGHKEPCWRKWSCQRIALRLHSLATSCLCHSGHHQLQDSKQSVTSCLTPPVPCLPCYGGPCLSFPWDGVWTTGKDTVTSLGWDMGP